MIIDEESLGFILLVAQKKSFEDFTLGSGKFMMSIFHNSNSNFIINN